jgi:hypothetical protein
MTLSFQKFIAHLPTNATDSSVAGDLKLQLGTMVNQTIDLNDSVVKPTAVYLDALVELTNESRTPNQVDFATKTFVGTPDKPILQYVISIPVSLANPINDLLDPTDI